MFQSIRTVCVYNSKILLDATIISRNVTYTNIILNTHKGNFSALITFPFYTSNTFCFCTFTSVRFSMQDFYLSKASEYFLYRCQLPKLVLYPVLLKCPLYPLRRYYMSRNIQRDSSSNLSGVLTEGFCNQQLPLTPGTILLLHNCVNLTIHTQGAAVYLISRNRPITK